MQSIKPGSLNGSRNGTELSRLLSAAIVSRQFRELLLTNPGSALVAGYNGESFRLETEDQHLVLSIRTTSLSDFALQLTQNRTGKS